MEVEAARLGEGIVAVPFMAEDKVKVVMATDLPVRAESSVPVLTRPHMKPHMKPLMKQPIQVQALAKVMMEKTTMMGKILLQPKKLTMFPRLELQCLVHHPKLNPLETQIQIQRQ